jgi:hypothetical protein
MVSLCVAGRPYNVVYAFGGILGQSQRWLSPSAVYFVDFCQRSCQDGGFCVHNGEKFVGIIRVEGSQVYNLLAIGIHNFEFLSLLDSERDGYASGKYSNLISHIMKYQQIIYDLAG